MIGLYQANLYFLITHQSSFSSMKEAVKKFTKARQLVVVIVEKTLHLKSLYDVVKKTVLPCMVNCHMVFQ